MPNPFAPLQDALRVLCTETQVLPATGQAVIDMVLPDIDEIYDRQTSGAATVDGIWETSADSLYRTVQPIHRTEKHMLCYFVDGSALAYFIGTVLEQDRSSPVQKLLIFVSLAPVARIGQTGTCAKRKKGWPATTPATQQSGWLLMAAWETSMKFGIVAKPAH